LTDDAASQASRCSARRLLNNLRKVSNKFLQFNRNGNYAYRRSEQAMARASGLASQRCVFVQDARNIFRG
jgi:hypothetical protein